MKVIERVDTGDVDSANRDYVVEMEAILKSVKRSKIRHTSTDIDCRFIRPTRNMCKRLFSISQFALTDNRKSLLHGNVEIQLVLKLNGHRWDIS